MFDFDIQLAFPVIAPALLGLVLLVLVRVVRGSRWALPTITLVGLALTGAIVVRLAQYISVEGHQITANGMIVIDGFGLFFSALVLMIAAMTVVASVRFNEREQIDHGEFYALILFCVAGMFLMLQTTHLMMVLIGLEIFSLSLYVLTGLTRGRVRSIEAALKYFLLGAFSSGFIIYGMALLYGSTGTLDMARIGESVTGGGSLMLWVGMGLLLVGFSFKIGAVPFHQWIPDVYEGAPTNVTGFMAAATKTVAFAVLVRFLIGAFSDAHVVWAPIITCLAILTMTVANLIALAQTNIKRMLAFSSIAHAGYLLIALVAHSTLGVEAIMFYLAAYGFMTVGVFTVVAALGRGDEQAERGYRIADLKHLGWNRPLLGLTLAFFLFSLAGIPPTAGFLGKYVIFRAAVESELWLLAVIGVLNAAVAAYYYLRVIVAMYMQEADTDQQPLPVPATMALVMVIASIAVIYLGVAPGRLLELISSL
jgi:NADH-quinone oxidoreductase subunit N